MSMITIKNLSYSKGERSILKNVSIDFAAGAITSILGPTGCGKTTLLRMISGLEVPQHGKIIIGDKTASENGKNIVQPNHRNIGFVFQDLALWPHLTVFKNISFGLEEQKDKNTREKVTKILEEFGISDQVRKFPHELSGGQKQLVAIARSVVLNPALLLLDEPVSNLDVQVEHKIIEHLKKVQIEKQLTIIWVMHDHKLALDHSHFITVMNNGTVEAHGTKESIIISNSSFIKEFIKY